MRTIPILITLHLLLLAIPMRAVQSTGVYAPPACDMQSTSPMRRQPSYRSTFGAQYSGSFRPIQNAPKSGVSPLKSKSYYHAAVHSYGTAAYSGVGAYSTRWQLQTGRNGIGTQGTALPPAAGKMTVGSASRGLTTPAVSRHHFRGSTFNHPSGKPQNGVLRRLGTIDDGAYYDEWIQEYMDQLLGEAWDGAWEDIDGYLYDDDEGNHYFSSEWYDDFLNWLEANYGAGGIGPNPWKDMQIRLPLGDNIVLLLLLSLLYLFGKSVSKKHI